MKLFELLEDMNDTEREFYIILLLALRDAGENSDKEIQGSMIREKV